MTADGGDHREESRDELAPFPHPDQPPPWQQYPHPPVDPQAPLNYPEYPPPYSGQPPPAPSYGYPPPPYGGPTGYGGQPGYPAGPYYDPYQGYPANPHQTNGLAIASLVTSIAGVVIGIPLAIFCYLGLLIPIVGAVLGVVALTQIKRTRQHGRGLAIAGIAVGSVTAAFVLLLMIVIALGAAALHSPLVNANGL